MLQTDFASLQSTECDTERLIAINVVCCRQQLLIRSADCDTEWLISINFVSFRQQLLLYINRIVILSG